jgi:3-oxo-4-pregnene-20-carboxyl-CoA dehydrogenase alpha subunit
MDFTPTEAQQAIATLAAEVLDRQPADPWKELGQAGLLAAALPEELGGDGLSVLEVGALLAELGRRATPGPALATLMLGVLPVTRLGRRDQQAALLDGAGSGDTLLTAAIREPSDPMPTVPATTAAPAPATVARDGGIAAVTGVKLGVPYAAEARWVLVPASLATGGTAVLAIDPHGAGVTLHPTPSSAGSPEYTVRLDAAPASHVLGGPGPGAVTLLYQLALAGACCLGDGALAGALALTTAYTGTRHQFGRPLATFQAAAQLLADTYVTARTLHLATESACWRLGTGRDADADLAVAGYWLAGQAPAALRACHHLHGGLGMDVSYPLHRYSALIKDLTRFTGGADYRLDALAATVYP